MEFNWPVVGHKKITDYLKTVVENGYINHAYLFCGSRGLGKTLVADYFIKSIFCISNEIKPCGVCSHCRQIEKVVHPDVIYLEAEEDKKNISVEQARELKVKVQTGTLLNSYKVVVIKEANKLSIGASNALLKILEEPAKKTVFIFLAESLSNILPTILSRMHLIKFLPVGRSEINKYLIDLGKENDKARVLSHMANGFPGLAVQMAQDDRMADEYKNKAGKIVSDIIGDINIRFKICEELAGQDKSNLARANINEWLAALSSIMRDAILFKNMCYDGISNVFLKNQLSILSQKYSSEKLVQILNRIKIVKKQLKQNVNMRLALENLMLEF